MRINLKHSALAIMAGLLAQQLMPAEHAGAVEWARGNLVVADGPKAGKLWDDALTPYIREPLSFCEPDSGVNEIAVRKSAQTGFTTLIIAAVGHSIDTDPCNIMIVQPTTKALEDFNKDKLSATIEQSKTLRKLVYKQISRDGGGSTSDTKRFKGGFIKLAIANSAADLRSKTIKKVFEDEVDEYPDDLDGQGDPDAMIEARQESFLMSGDWLRVYVSTPTIKGASRIERRFEAGDQRYWHVPCPGCGEHFKLVFDRTHFKFNDMFPYEPHYVAPCCGTIVEAHEKLSLVRKGKWVAEAPRPGAYPSYHFDALSSPFVPWEKIAARYIEADGDPLRLKAFYNLTLGLAYEMKGDAPDHVRLMERRQPDIIRGRIPPRGLIVVGSADVQMNGIWYLFKAYSADRQSWRIDAGYLDGSTEDPHGEVFRRLDELRLKEWPDAFGNKRRADAFAIDSGYRSHIVYTWARGKNIPPVPVFAIKGLDGWSRPAMGAPSPQEINFAGKRIPNGIMLWGVGTWPLKGAFYANLRKEGIAAGKDIDPPGYCHFGSWMDEVYFRQITSEYLATKSVKGRSTRLWQPRAGEENHLLDCEVYGDAIFDYLGGNRMTSDEWSRLATLRGAPDEAINPDMFAPEALQVSSQSAPSKTSLVPELEDDLAPQGLRYSSNDVDGFGQQEF